jgi:hypothetical protein
MPQQTTAVMAPAAPSRRYRVDRWFFIGAGVFVILVSVVGFGPSIIDQSKRNAPPTPLVIAHGIISCAWLLLFIVQATLVATRRVAVHRRVGMVGPALAVVMIALGFFAVIEEVRRGHDLSGDLTRVFSGAGFRWPNIAPLSSFLHFGVLVAAGLWYRHRPDIHKRLMLLALTPLAAEPLSHFSGYLLGRWPDSQGVLTAIVLPTTLLLLSVSAIHDKVSQGRIHPVSVWVPLILIVDQAVLPAVLVSSTAGQQLADWLTR